MLLESKLKFELNWPWPCDLWPY